jgi:hypothetical protein
MIIFNAMLLGICLVYGWIVAKLFGGCNYNAVWLWTTFILFVINDLTVKILALNSNNEEE